VTGPVPSPDAPVFKEESSATPTTDNCNPKATTAIASPRRRRPGLPPAPQGESCVTPWAGARAARSFGMLMMASKTTNTIPVTPPK